jgi:hypothetical protein
MLTDADPIERVFHVKLVADTPDAHELKIL